MRRGEYGPAWELSDRMLRERAGTPCGHLPRHLQYIWDGSPIEGRRVLVRCYHGLGDTIQFVRYVPLLKAQGCEVLVWAQPVLLPLLGHVEGIDRLLPLHDGDAGVSREVDVEIMELPHVVRTTLGTLPARVPYVHVDPLTWPPSEMLRAGLVWRAGEWGEHRSIPFEELGPLVEVPVTWYVLQGYPGLTERPDGFGTVVGATDIVELARAIRALDVVITVDSMAAHLAGALGTPVWTLLSHDPDWRWMADRDDSPWYPTMRLFRQERAGDWEPVIARAARELRTLAAHRQG